jgi:hypothetical protein
MAKRSPKNVALGAREYGKFRETIDGEYVVGMSVEDYATFVTHTCSDSDTVLAAQGANKAIKVKYIMVNNAGTAQNLVSIREGSSGTVRFLTSLPQYGGTWNANLINCAWLLPANTALYATLGGAGTVYVTIGYEVVDVSTTRLALTESVTIAESQARVSA